jgi:hypothetical protein
MLRGSITALSSAVQPSARLVNGGYGCASDRIQDRRPSLLAEKPEEVAMTHVFFHCCSAERVMLDPCGADVDDLIEARERAIRVVREFVTSRGLEDWRAWTLRVSDADGEEIFLMPFSCVIGRPH